MRLKKILSMLLAMAMLFTSVGITAMAEESVPVTTSTGFELSGDLDLSEPTGGEASDNTETEAVFTIGSVMTTTANTLEDAIVAVEYFYETIGNTAILGAPVITLNTNYEFTAPVVIDSEYPIIIDLNGHTLSYTSTTQGEAMITNKGTLTIKDSVGTGAINYNYIGEADTSYSKGNYTISNAGTLTVDGGKITIANLKGHAKYPIDNNSTTGDAILVINGGHLYNYNTSAIRQFCNSSTYDNSVTINGGLIEGYNAIWVQNPGKDSANGSLSITDGEIRTTAAAYVNGTAELKAVSSAIYCTLNGDVTWSDDSAIRITGGEINENVNLAEQAPTAITVDESVCNGNVYIPAEATEPPTSGTIIGYTSESTIWGETWCNARESYVIKIYSDDTFMGQSELNSGIFPMNGNVKVTWNIRLDAESNTDEYWIMSWDVVPSLEMQPTHVAIEVDGVETSKTAIKLNGPDNLNPIYAAIADENGKITSYATSLANAAAVAEAGDTVLLLRDSAETVEFVAGVTVDKNGYTTDGVTVAEPVAVAEVNGTEYVTFAGAVAAATSGDTIKLIADVAIAEGTDVTIPDGVTLNGNGFTISASGADHDTTTSYGYVVAGGNLTIKGITKIEKFSASYYKHIITIGEGACLEVFGKNRVSVGYGSSFYVTGSVADAKTADKSEIQPSLNIAAGISIVGGNDTVFEVKNAYVIIGDTSSKNSNAGGKFDITFENSIVDFTKQFSFATPKYDTLNPVFNVNVKDSVMTTATKLMIAAPGTVMTVDNSDVTLGSYLRNSGELTIQNNSTFTGSMIQYGENGGNDGDIFVDNSVFTIKNNNTAYAMDGKEVGSIILTNGAIATVDYIKDSFYSVDATSTLNANLINCTEYIVAVAQIDETKYATLAEAIAAAQNGDTITVISNIVLTDGITIPADKEITLDLAGNTITGTPAETKAFAVINNKGDFTIDDTVGAGKIVCDHQLAGSTSYAVNTITNAGKLTVENGVIENKSTATNQIGYAIDNNSTTSDAVVTVNGGEIKVSGSYYYDGIRQFCNSTTLENSIVVNGGNVSSIWMQNPSDSASERNTKNVKGSIGIADGRVGAIYLEPSTGFVASVTDGEIGTLSHFETSEGRDLVGFVSGGTFEVKPEDDFAAEGYEIVQNEDGKYEVTEKAELFDFAGVNTTLGNTLSMNFYVDKSNIVGDGYYAIVEHYLADKTKNIVTIYQNEWQNDESGGFYYVSYTGIAAKQMADKVKITIHKNDGTQASVGYTDSLKEYAMRGIGKLSSIENPTAENLAEITTLVDMLNYGAEAQKFFDYNVENLANSEAASYQDFATKQESVVLNDNCVKSNEYAFGSTLTLENSILLSSFFFGIKEDMYAMVSFTEHYGNDEYNYRIEYSEFRPNNSAHEIIVDKLFIADADQEVTITVHNSDGSVHSQIKDSMNSFMRRAIDNSDDDEFYYSIAKFTKSAYNYLHIDN